MTMTEVVDLGQTLGDAAKASVEHCIITSCKGPSRTRTAGRSASFLCHV